LPQASPKKYVKAAELQATPAAQEIKVICLAAGVAAGVALIPLKNISAPRQLELAAHENTPRAKFQHTGHLVI
jgi:hypothetical protein